MPYTTFDINSVGECYTILPLTSVRLSRMQVPQANLADKNKWFDEAPEITPVALKSMPDEEEIGIAEISTSLEISEKQVSDKGLPKKETINHSKDKGMDSLDP